MTDDEFLEECISELDEIKSGAMDEAMASIGTGTTCECIDDVLGNVDDALWEITKVQSDLDAMKKRIKSRLRRGK